MKPRLLLLFCFLLGSLGTSLGACTSAIDEAGDPADECATCAGGKADGIAPDSCDAAIIVEVANTATFTELDIAARLNRRAAQNITDARSEGDFQTIGEVDDVSYVGSSAILALLEYGRSQGVDCDAPDSCALPVIVRVANGASLETLDDEIGLDSRAARGIVEGRPFSTVAEVDAVSYVGASALGKLQAYGESNDPGCDSDGPTDTNLGIISDLDKTVIPPSSDDLSEAPYPGVVTLYDILRDGSDRLSYVTARTPERILGVPEYLEDHGLPTGPIDTGVSGIPWIAQAEKVRDASRVFDANPGRPYVLFGDTSHRDPEAYKEMLELYPDRVSAGLIHMVNITVSDHRLVGLHLYHNYAEAAAILTGLSIITEAEAREVFEAAQSEGLELSEAEFEELLSEHSE